MKVYNPIFLTALGSAIAFFPTSVVAQTVAPEAGKPSPKPLKISKVVVTEPTASAEKALATKPLPAKPLSTNPLSTNPLSTKPLPLRISKVVVTAEAAVASTPATADKSLVVRHLLPIKTLAQTNPPLAKPATTVPIVPGRLEANPTMIQPTFETPNVTPKLPTAVETPAVPVQPASPLPPARSTAPAPKAEPKPETKLEVKPEVKPAPAPASKVETPLPPDKSPSPASRPVTPPMPSVVIPPPTIVPRPIADPVGPAPGYVNPKAKALLFPTQPEEVKLVGVQPITLQQALKLAEQNNRELSVARLQIEGARAAVRQSEASLYPTLDLQSSFSRSQSAASEISVQAGRIQAIRAAGGQRSLAEIFSPQAFRLDGNATRTAFDAAVQINYNIFTSGQRSGQIQASKQQLRAVELQYERTFEQLMFDVTDDYYRLQDADEQVLINEAAVKSTQKNLQDVEAQERAGLGTKFDVLRAQVQLANNLQQLTNSKGNREIGRRQLAQRLSLSEVVGVIAGEEVQKANLLQPLATPEGRLAPLENLIVLAYSNRVELQEQLIQRDLSETQRKVALAALGPTVSLRGQYAVEKQFEQPVSGLADGYSLSVQAQWRLLDGGAARASAQQQQANLLIAEERFAQARNQVRFQVEQAYANIIANESSIKTTEDAVRQAEEALRLAILRFEAGVGTQTDRINAESDLTRARGNRLTAIIGYNRSLAQLRRAVSNTTLLPQYNKTAAR